MIALVGGDTDSPGSRSAETQSVLSSLLGVLEKGDPSFNIVTP